MGDILAKNLLKRGQFEGILDTGMTLTDRYLFSPKTLQIVESIQSLKDNLTTVNRDFYKFHNNKNINAFKDSTRQIENKLFESSANAKIKMSLVKK